MFDQELGGLLKALHEDDLLFITADHGCDPTDVSTDHTREYVPLLVAGPRISNARNLGTRRTFADLGATICDYLSIPPDGFPGRSALSELY
jgi:phosphopentomutase